MGDRGHPHARRPAAEHAVRALGGRARARGAPARDRRHEGQPRPRRRRRPGGYGPGPDERGAAPRGVRRRGASEACCCDSPSAMDQQIRFCSIAAGRIAYAEVGAGPALVLPAWWVSHLELDWERAGLPRLRRGACRPAPRGPLRPAGHGALRPQARRRGTAAWRASSKRWPPWCGAAEAGAHRAPRDLERGLPGRGLCRA